LFNFFKKLQVTNENYTYFEVAMRSVFGLTSVIFFMYFVLITIRCQNWRKWHTTQKWLPVFLFLQIFYHDPIFGLQAVVGGEGWAIYHATASLAFIFSFLLYLLIFVHGLFVVRNLKFFTFLGSKRKILLEILLFQNLFGYCNLPHNIGIVFMEFFQEHWKSSSCANLRC
jgi:hypothetical protein